MATPQHVELNKKLLSVGTLKQLCDCVRDSNNSFNFINCSTALRRFARLVEGGINCKVSVAKCSAAFETLLQRITVLFQGNTNSQVLWELLFLLYFYIP